MSGSLDVIAARCFAREAREQEQEKRQVAVGASVGFALVSMLLIWGLAPDYLVPVVVVLLFMLVLVRVLPRPIRGRVRRRMKELHDGDPDAIHVVSRYAADEFRRLIETHRVRTLGKRSDWAAARAQLRKAVDDAQGSAAYWKTRLTQESDNPLVTRQLKTAGGLEAKLREALTRLDARADVLLRFYNDCEARLGAMDRHSRDIAEARRLHRLSGTANVVIAEAEDTLAAIGASFVREARRVGEVLGGFERLQIKSLAGEAPLDDIEYLADRIIESSESELAAVEELKSALNQMEE